MITKARCWGTAAYSHGLAGGPAVRSGAPRPLAFPEIAEEPCLSPHTITSQAMSLYRKLGVSRSQAVARSRELGLLEG